MGNYLTRDNDDIRPKLGIVTNNVQQKKIIREQVGELPGFTFEYNKHCNFMAETQCCICFEDYANRTILQMLPCNHVIHYPCMKSWYYTRNKTCPICRYDYSTGK